MTDNQGATNCKWAVPTLFLSTPGWVDAEARPWACLRDEDPVEMESTAYCARCVRWEQRTEPAATGAAGSPRYAPGGPLVPEFTSEL